MKAVTKLRLNDVIDHHTKLFEDYLKVINDVADELGSKEARLMFALGSIQISVRDILSIHNKIKQQLNE